MDVLHPAISIRANAWQALASPLFAWTSIFKGLQNMSLPAKMICSICCSKHGAYRVVLGHYAYVGIENITLQGSAES